MIFYVTGHTSRDFQKSFTHLGHLLPQKLSKKASVFLGLLDDDFTPTNESEPCVGLLCASTQLYLDVFWSSFT